MPKIISSQIIKEYAQPNDNTISLGKFDRILKDAHSLVTILVTRFVGLGDVLLTLPVLKALKEKYVGLDLNVAIDFQTSRKFIELISRFDFVNEIISTLNKSYTLTINLQDTVDYLPMCSKDHRLDLLAELCGVKDFLDRDFKFPVVDQDILKSNKILKDIGIDTNKKIVAVSPISQAMIRSWGNFRELPRILPNIQFILLHSKKINHINGYYDLSGQLQVEDLPGVLIACDAIISADNGILHLAGMLKKPLVALFGPINPDYRTRYYNNKVIIWNRDSCDTIPCWDHGLKICTKEGDQSSPCLDSITANQVVYGLEKLFNKGDYQCY